MPEYSFTAEIWLYPGKAAWHFASVPTAESAQIKTLFGGLSKGWGSIPVNATIGKASWRTSIFPDSKSGQYLLPLKAAVRKQAQVKAGDSISIILEVLGN